MNDIETLLKQTLDEQASRVVDPDPTVRARLITAQAPPARRAPRLVALGLATVVLAGGGFLAREAMKDDQVAVPDPMGTVSPTTSSTPSISSTPTTSSSPTTAATTSSKTTSPSTSPASTVSVAPPAAPAGGALPSPSLPVGTTTKTAMSKLPSGAEGQLYPRVSTRQGSRVILLPGRTVPMPKGARDIAQAIPVADGWLVRTASDSFTGGGPDTAAEIFLLGRDGSTRTVADSGSNSHMALSPDGKSVARVYLSEGKVPKASLVIAPLDGSERADHPLGGAAGEPVPDTMSVLAWTQSGIVVEGNLPTDENAHLWIADPKSGALKASRSLSDIWQLAPGRTVQFTNKANQECATLVVVGAADRSLMCANHLVSRPVVGGGIWVESVVNADDAPDAKHGTGVLVTADQATSSVRPSWLPMEEWALEAGNQDAVLVPVFDETDKSTQWVRWNLTARTLEKVNLPA